MMMMNNAIDCIAWLACNLQPETDFLMCHQRVILNCAITSIQLHPPPPSSFQPPTSSLQHPQQYLNQNIAHNWAISPNLGPKTKCYPFCLKTGTHDKVEVLIPNPDLDFRKFDTKIHFWANLGPQSQSCLFCLKIGTRMLILTATLVFWISNPNFFFGKICMPTIWQH